MLPCKKFRKGVMAIVLEDCDVLSVSCYIDRHDGIKYHHLKKGEIVIVYLNSTARSSFCMVKTPGNDDYYFEIDKEKLLV